MRRSADEPDSLQVPCASDVDAWLAIQNAAFRGRPRPWSRADFERELQQRGWFRPELVWLAEPCEAAQPGTSVGTIALELPDEALTGRIHWLAVGEQWQRQGIGRRLVERLERECWQRGGRRVVLETLGHWISVIGFYESLGYREHRDGSAGN